MPAAGWRRCSVRLRGPAFCNREQCRLSWERRRSSRMASLASPSQLLAANVRPSIASPAPVEPLRRSLSVHDTPFPRFFQYPRRRMSADVFGHLKNQDHSPLRRHRSRENWILDGGLPVGARRSTVPRGRALCRGGVSGASHVLCINVEALASLVFRDTEVLGEELHDVVGRSSARQ